MARCSEEKTFVNIYRARALEKPQQVDKLIFFPMACHFEAAAKEPVQLFNKNTGLC